MHTEKLKFKQSLLTLVSPASSIDIRDCNIIYVTPTRDGFRERGTLGHLSFGGPTQVWPIGPFVWNRESMPLLCVVLLKNLSFVVPTLVLQLH